MDLQELRFRVDTKELDTAVTKVGELGEAVSKVNTPLSELAKNSKGAAKGAADFSASAGKAGKGAKELADNTDAVDAKLQKLRDQLGFLRNDLNMSETGFSKMQAGVMASMKAIGASDAQLKQFATTFDQFNKIMGEQALDKSVAGLNMLNRQMREFQMTNELAAKGFNLTSTQVKQLARDIEALQQQNQEFGRSATSGVDELTKKYVSAANSVNQYIAAAKESEQAAKREAQAAIEAAKAKDLHNAAIEKQYELVRKDAWKEYGTSIGKTSEDMQKLNDYFRQQESAMEALDKQKFDSMGIEKQASNIRKQAIDEATKAEQYMIRETERLIFVNEKLADGFTVASANALFKYQEALQKTGRTADQVQKELADLGVELMKKQGTSPISSMRKDIQQLDQSVNHLARNIGVQFTDIFVSLANGQSIFQVATQQGGQLADAFLLAGISGGKMTDQLVEGAKAIYSSYKVLLSAFLDLAGRGIMSAGNAIVDFGSKVTGTNSILNATRSIIESFGGDSEKFISIVDKMGASFRVAAGVGVGLLVAGFVSMGVAMVQVLKEQQALNLAINTTGASLGLTKDSAIELTRSLSDIGVNTTNATAVLTELAKGGTLSAESFEYVAEAADKMQKYAGVSIDKTVADFNKLAKEPAKNLAELAGKTGYVTEETLRYIQSLEDEGKQIEAVQAATEAMAEAKIKAAESAYASASPLIQLWIDIKSAVSDAWSAFKDATSQGEGLAAIIRVAWETVAVIVSEVWYVLKMTGKEIGGIAAMISRVLVGDFAGAKTIWNSMGEDAKKAREQQDATVKSIIEGVKVVQDAGAKEREENARSAASFEEKEKARKKALEESKRAAEKAANELAKYISKIEEKIRDLSISTQAEWSKMFTASDDLTKSQKMMLDIIDDPLFKSLPDREKERQLAVLAQNHALEVQISLEKERLEVLRKIWQGTVDAQTKADNFAMDEVANYEEQKRILESNNKDLIFRESLIGKTAQEQKNLTREYEAQKKIASAQLDLEKKKAAAQEKFAGAADKAQLEELKQLYETEYADKIKLINKEIAIQAAEDIEASFKDIQSTLADIISTALFEGGKAGQKKLKDVLKAAFSSFVLNVLINPITQGVGASIGNTLLGTSNSGISSIGTLIGEGFNSYISNTAFGALLSSSAGYAAAIGGGSIAAGSQAAMLAAQTGGFGAAGTALTAQAAGGISGSLGGIYSSLMSNPWTLALGAGLLLFGDDIIGGLFGDAGTAHTGGVGSYSATGGTSYGVRSGVVKGYTGGVAFGADAYSEQTAKGSAELAKGMVTLLDSFAQTFGKEVGYYVGTGFADDTSGDGAWGGLLVKLGDKIIKDWGRGVDKWPGREFANGEAGQQGYLTALATDVRSVLTDIAPDWADDILSALGDAPTIDQLSNAVAYIGKILGIFEQMGNVMPQLSNLSSDAQTNLMALAGGIDNLGGMVSSYYGSFYSEAEKVENVTSQLTDTMNSLGLEMPTTREQFRALVEAQDLNTEAGQSMYITLMNLASAFDQVLPAFDSLSSTLTSLQSNTDNAFAVLQAAVNKEKSILETRKTALESNISTLQKVFDVLQSSINQLYGTVDSTNQMQIAAARTLISEAVSSGVLPDSDTLSKAIQTITGSQVESKYATKADMDRDRLRLAAELGKLQDIAEPQLTTAEKQLQVLEDQLSYYDQLLQKYQDQIDAIRGNSTLSVVDAIAQLENALVAELQNIASIISRLQSGVITPSQAISSIEQSTGVNLTPGQWTTAGGEKYWASTTGNALGYFQGGESYFTGATGTTHNIAGSANWINQQLAAGNAQGVLDKAKAEGLGTTELDAILGLAPGSSAAYIQNNGLAFAEGGYYPGGLALVGEEGPELINFNQPGQVYTAAQSANLLNSNDSALIEELQALRSEVIMLRAEVRADVSHNAKTAKLLDRVIPDGQSIQVTTVV